MIILVTNKDPTKLAVDFLLGTGTPFRRDHWIRLLVGASYEDH